MQDCSYPHACRTSLCESQHTNPPWFRTLRPPAGGYESCALPTTPMCNAVVIGRIELSTSMVSAWRSTVELYHSMSGHTVTIRVLLLKRQEHHLNALAGNCPAFLSMSIYIATKFFVEVAGVEPTCNQLRFELIIILNYRQLEWSCKAHHHVRSEVRDHFNTV